MSSYGEAVSIFQLAFGLNAALPTVYFTYRRTHDAVARRLAEEMNKIDPSLTLGERELIVVRHYVRYGFPAMRNSRPVGIATAGLFGLALLLSFSGLVRSAVDSQGHLDNCAVILFSAFALVICPIAGILYSFLMLYSERQIVLRIDGNVASSFIPYVRRSLIMEDLGRKTQALTEEAKALALDLNYSSAQEDLSMVWRDLNSNMRNRLKELRKVFRQ